MALLAVAIGALAVARPQARYPETRAGDFSRARAGIDQKRTRDVDRIAHLQNYTMRKLAVSDSEIAADLLVVEHVGLLSGLAHLFDRDRVEIGEKRLARPTYGRIDHPLKEHRV